LADVSVGSKKTEKLPPGPLPALLSTPAAENLTVENQMRSICVMPQSAILRTRMNSRRKARVEKILEGLGLTPSQAVNLFFAQIERRKAIPFALALDDRADILPPIEQVAKVWDGLDDEDFSHLDPRRGR